MPKSSLANDGRLIELIRLGQTERESSRARSGCCERSRAHAPYIKRLITGRDVYVRATSTKPAAANIATVPV
jgi:hypothetical protein